VSQCGGVCLFFYDVERNPSMVVSDVGVCFLFCGVLGCVCNGVVSVSLQCVLHMDLASEVKLRQRF
jgi:hypothetical protein